jgi:hypothetical protein
VPAAAAGRRQGVGKALNCSVNDVLLSCVAGAIGGYLRQQGDDTTGQEIRAMIPVNLRPMEEAWKLGNHFGLVPLVLPIGMDNPIERVYEVRSRMRRSRAAPSRCWPSACWPWRACSSSRRRTLLNLFSKKTTAVMTNVPGPRRPATCAARASSSACSGCRSRATWGWACPS